MTAFFLHLLLLVAGRATPVARPAVVVPASAPALQDDKGSPPAPTREEIAAAVDAVRSALRTHDAQAARTALEAATTVPDGEVVRAVARALDEKDPIIVVAALQALRFLEHPGALDALHEAAKERDRRMTTEIAVPLFRAIGQHGDPESIEILARNINENPANPVVQARILALGHIRSERSVETLIGLLVLTGPNGKHRVLAGWKNDFRLALMALTGVDNGLEAELWERWWRANRKEFQVPEEFPTLPEDLAKRWKNYWGEGRAYERRKRREDRRRDD